MKTVASLLPAALLSLHFTASGLYAKDPASALQVATPATGSAAPSGAKNQIPNSMIDYPQFHETVRAVEKRREERRITEKEFAAMAAEPGTVVLDARSADKYALRHIKGAVSLPFTDFTAESLARVIPTKATRVLIYCNNNFRGAPVSLAAKAAPASLNMSTYVALTTYGYTNIYELGPLLDVSTTLLPFEGTEVSK